MILLLAPALLAVEPAQNAPCPPNPLYKLRDYDDTRPAERAGRGLWIGGVSFAPSDIASARPRQDAISEQWGINLAFAPSGKARFDTIQRCREQQPIEISMDRAVISRPRLIEHIRGNEVMVSGSFTQESAAALAARIAPAP